MFGAKSIVMGGDRLLRLKCRVMVEGELLGGEVDIAGPYC